jgi:hypothetical protein
MNIGKEREVLKKEQSNRKNNAGSGRDADLRQVEEIEQPVEQP